MKRFLQRRNTFTLKEFYNRKPVPEPWAEGDNIPWHDPAFSRRMLQEHLDQNHDRASRRFSIIDQHVDWIHRFLLQSQPSRILDLGCGPGFYAHRLATLGHTVTGIDYSPASIDYAEKNVNHFTKDRHSETGKCTFHLTDVRTPKDYTFGCNGYHLIMMLYGEFNVFCPDHAEQIIERAAAALKPGGILLLEPQTHDAIYKTGMQVPFWSQANRGVFGDAEHFWLEEFFWDAATETTTIRYHVIDPGTARVTSFAQTFQAWSEKSLDQLLGKHGFEMMGSTTGDANDAVEDDADGDLMFFVVRQGYHEIS